MQDKAILQVRVTESEGEITYGTAYLINQRYAITALHVVQDYKAILFVFSNGEETSEFKIQYKSAECDIAVISFSDTSLLDSLPKIEKIRIGEAKKDDRWHGAGYPKFSENEQCRDLEQIQGECYRCPEEEFFFNISCGKQPKLQQWGGVSGAPVFVGNKLTAIICSYDTALENTHFDASAIWKL